MIAEWQQLVFSEFLPVLLGPSVMEKHDLNLAAITTNEDPILDSFYDPNLNPQVCTMLRQIAPKQIAPRRIAPSKSPPANRPQQIAPKTGPL